MGIRVAHRIIAALLHHRNNLLLATMARLPHSSRIPSTMSTAEIAHAMHLPGPHLHHLNKTSHRHRATLLKRRLYLVIIHLTLPSLLVHRLQIHKAHLVGRTGRRLSPAKPLLKHAHKAPSLLFTKCNVFFMVTEFTSMQDATRFLI